MNELKIFESEKFGKVRTVVIDGEPWFVGKDVAEALGYANTRDALATHVEEEDKKTVVISDGKRGNPNQVIINESGLYALIFGSRLKSAKEFKHWVTSEVLPSIRKTGKYEANKNNTIIPTVAGSLTQIPPLGNWYDKMKLRIDALCEIYDTSRKQLYHLILTQVQGKYSWDYAVMAYINETGSAPRYPMDVVAHFQQLQTEAENIINILLEHAGYNI